MTAFEELVGQYSQAEGQGRSASDLKRIEGEIWDKYGMVQAVLVLDMAGFSRLTQKYGIVHYLSMIHRMHRAVEQPVSRNSGSIVKFEADNMFARLPSTEAAILSGIEINHVLSGMNTMTSQELDVHVSIGIDFGKFLLIRKKDLFGDPVNLASRLGEDLAVSGEILVSDGAMKLVPKKKFNTERVSFNVSGQFLDAHKIVF